MQIEAFEQRDSSLFNFVEFRRETEREREREGGGREERQKSL
jgi:hypothetical protein